MDRSRIIKALCHVPEFRADWEYHHDPRRYRVTLLALLHALRGARAAYVWLTDDWWRNDEHYEMLAAVYEAVLDREVSHVW